MPSHDAAIAKLFSSVVPSTLRFTAREGVSVEFKESFNWGSKDKYAKVMAAFSNNRGGYLVFGVGDAPRRLVGLSSGTFDALDEATISGYLNGVFSPAIHFEKFSREVHGKKVGVISVGVHESGPVIAIKTDGDVREAEIYYRYNARNDKIKYPELKGFFERERERERKGWLELFQRVGKVGPDNSAILNLASGVIEGEGGPLLIDAGLLPKLRFVKEGSFAEKGRPVLKLVGDVRPVAVTAAKAARAVRITDDPTAPAVREETLLATYPLTYKEMMDALDTRYRDFKQNEAFHRICRDLKGNAKYCHTRYLDPRQKKLRKDYFSTTIFEVFDRHYTPR